MRNPDLITLPTGRRFVSPTLRPVAENAAKTLRYCPQAVCAYATILCDRSVFQLVGTGIHRCATGEGVFLYTNNWPRERLVASAQRFRKSELLEVLAPEQEVVQVGGFHP